MSRLRETKDNLYYTMDDAVSDILLAQLRTVWPDARLGHMTYGPGAEFYAEFRQHADGDVGMMRISPGDVSVGLGAVWVLGRTLTEVADRLDAALVGAQDRRPSEGA